MAAASLHDDVLLDSEERHERAPPCAYAYDDSLVGSPAGTRGCGIAAQVSRLSGMPQVDVMEELSALCGGPCWQQKDSITTQGKKIKER